VPPSVKALGTIGFLGGVATARDDGQGPFILDLLAYFLAVVGLVRGDGDPTRPNPMTLGNMRANGVRSLVSLFGWNA